VVLLTARKPGGTKVNLLTVVKCFSDSAALSNLYQGWGQPHRYAARWENRN